MRYFRSTQMKKFYADEVGVPVWWIALVIAIAVSIDALTDPLIGFFSDSLRWTYKDQPMRRRPFIAIGSVVMSVFYLLLWSPCLGGGCASNQPTLCEDQTAVGGAAVFFLICYAAYYSTMGTMLIPYEALGAELTPDHADRSNLFAVYFGFTVAGILVAILAPGVVSDEKTGYFILALIFVVLFVTSSWNVAVKLKESAVHEENPPAVPSMINCLRNPVFKILLLNQTIEAVGAATQFTVISFVVDYVIDPEYDSDGTKRLEDGVLTAKRPCSIAVTPLHDCSLLAFAVPRNFAPRRPELLGRGTRVHDARWGTIGL